MDETVQCLALKCSGAKKVAGMSGETAEHITSLPSLSLSPCPRSLRGAISRKPGSYSPLFNSPCAVTDEVPSS